MVKRFMAICFILFLVGSGSNAQQKDVKIVWIDPTSNNAVVTDNPFYLEFKILTKEKNLPFYITNAGRSWRIYLTQKNDSTYSAIEKVKLDDGENKLTIKYKISDDIYLIDSLTLIKEEEEEEKEGYGVTMSSNFSRSDYAVIISNSDYENWPKLENTRANARDIAEELELSYDFKVQFMENVDHYGFLAEFATILDYGCNSTDQLLVFIEGHGLIDSGSTHIVLTNSSTPSSYDPTRSMVSYNSIIRMINQKNCNNVLLVLDVLKPTNTDTFENVPEVVSMNLEGEALKRFSLGVPTKKYITNSYKNYKESESANHKKELSSVLLEALRTYGGYDGVLTLKEIMSIAQNKSTQLNYGTFSPDDNLRSDFVFIAR